MTNDEKCDGPGGRGRPKESSAGMEEFLELAANLGDDPSRDLARRFETDAAERGFRALRRVATTVSENLDFPSLVEQVLDIAIEYVGADRGLVFIGSEQSDGLTPIANRAVAGREIESLERVSWTVLRRAAQGLTTHSPDIYSDPAFEDVASVRVHGIRSVLCVPMLARGRWIGVLYLDSVSTPRSFSDHAREFIDAFAGIAAVALENARLHGDLLRENQRLRRRMDSLEAFGRILTVNARMVAMVKRASVAAQVDSPVMLLGESGTGKELLARAIHESSPRATKPFVAYNCAAVPSGLMESIFFGHTRGAFTGASRDNLGLFRMADQGTLFLDEFAELEESLQAKLLRVLQDGVVLPVGSETEIAVDVRLVTATSRDIQQAVLSGRFREDLFFRTNVLELRIPPLRERPDDVPVLAEHFLTKHRRDGEPRLHFDEAALELLQSLEWRGNVRELENFIQRVVVFATDHVVGEPLVRQLLSRGTRVASPAPASSEAPTFRPSPPSSLADQEREAIQVALAKAGGNKSKAARLLGIHRNSLLRRMKRFGIEWED